MKQFHKELKKLIKCPVQVEYISAVLRRAAQGSYGTSSPAENRLFHLWSSYASTKFKGKRERELVIEGLREFLRD